MRPAGDTEDLAPAHVEAHVRKDAICTRELLMEKTTSSDGMGIGGNIHARLRPTMASTTWDAKFRGNHGPGHGRP
ncbi:hypothetical protein Rumeso_03504 [Rubellimicrobium mesophilum DSM 19309]|uniref:Uncharacterized protein n=1 Tax=Rubellimicrobium mesophilum DSM 19309 TaxID=442562 RepID=A0A017HL88_9RHOB|nr:hypothetical protein Rumeso_03504 [Rubellimicrobium mesophilum DSM 19309]